MVNLPGGGGSVVASTQWRGARPSTGGGGPAASRGPGPRSGEASAVAISAPGVAHVLA